MSEISRILIETIDWSHLCISLVSLEKNQFLFYFFSLSASSSPRPPLAASTALLHSPLAISFALLYSALGLRQSVRAYRATALTYVACVCACACAMCVCVCVVYYLFVHTSLFTTLALSLSKQLSTVLELSFCCPLHCSLSLSLAYAAVKTAFSPARQSTCLPVVVALLCVLYQSSWRLSAIACFSLPPLSRKVKHT